MAKQILSRHYTRILTLWPTDALRPTVSFQKALQHRLDALPSSSPSSSQQDKADNVVANDALASVPVEKKFDERGEMEQVNALYSFLEGRYSKKYPLSERMLKPASHPGYYDELMKELEEAPNRSWFGRLVRRWKGFVRLS